MIFEGLTARFASGEGSLTDEPLDRGQHSQQESVLSTDSLGKLARDLPHRMNRGASTPLGILTSDVQKADVIWMRVLTLAGFQSRKIKNHTMSWLDFPNRHLGELSPFAATKDDESYARAYALLQLNPKGQLVVGSKRHQTFVDFCTYWDDHGELASKRKGEFIRSLWTLTGCTIEARFRLTTVCTDTSEGMTVFQLMLADTISHSELVEVYHRTHFHVDFGKYPSKIVKVRTTPESYTRK